MRRMGNEIRENTEEKKERRHREATGAAMEGVDVKVVKPSTIIAQVKEWLGIDFDEALTRQILLDIVPPPQIHGRKEEEY